MIVILNTLESPEARETAEGLAARLERGALLDLWALGRRQVRARASESSGDLVLVGAFDDCASLAGLRLALGQHDDEVYAFLLDL